MKKYPNRYCLEKEVAREIKAEAARGGTTNRRLAKMLGIHANTLGRQLNNSPSFIKLGGLCAIAKALDIPLSILIARAESRLDENRKKEEMI